MGRRQPPCPKPSVRGHSCTPEPQQTLPTLPAAPNASGHPGLFPAPVTNVGLCQVQTFAPKWVMRTVAERASPGMGTGKQGCGGIAALFPLQQKIEKKNYKIISLPPAPQPCNCLHPPAKHPAPPCPAKPPPCQGAQEGPIRLKGRWGCSGSPALPSPALSPPTFTGPALPTVSHPQAPNLGVMEKRERSLLW